MTRKIIRGNTSKEDFINILQVKPNKRYARRSKNNAGVALLARPPVSKIYFWLGVTAAGNSLCGEGDFYESLWATLIQPHLELYEFETKAELRDWLKVWL